MGRPEEGIAPSRSLLSPCLLLLLAEAPAHGYLLIERLKSFGFDWGGPGPIYGELRKLAGAGLISSAWDHSDARGPARRVYELDELGSVVLDRHAKSLTELAVTLNEFLLRYRAAAAARKG